MFIEFTWKSISSVIIIYSILFWILKFPLNFSFLIRNVYILEKLSALVDFLFLISCSYKQLDMTLWLKTNNPFIMALVFFLPDIYMVSVSFYSVSLSIVTSVNFCGYQNLFIFSWILNDTLSAYRLLGCYLYGPSILKIPFLPICLYSYFSCIFLSIINDI